MSEVLDLPPVPVAERICARCAHSRGEDGQPFDGHNLIFCAHPSVVSDTGEPVHCASQRFPARGSALLQQCGVDGILFESRNP